MNRSIRVEHGVLAAGLVGLILVIAFPFLHVIMPGKAEASPPPKPPTACQQMKNNARYLAYDQATKTDNFGPAVRERKVRQVVREFDSRLRLDASLTSVEAAYFRVGGFTFRNYAANTRRLETDCSLWKQTIRKIDRRITDAKSVRIVTSTASYHTLWFTRGNDDQTVPGLRQGTIPGRQSVVLKIVAKNGETYMLRLECGFQPFAPGFPPVVPPISTPPHQTSCAQDCGHQPPGCTHKCTTTPPPCTGTKCHPTHCVCVHPTQVSQSPLPPPVQPSNVPAHEPSAQPTHPVDPSSPGAPNTGSNNGGSTQQPGQSGSPTPVVPSDDPTNTGDPGGF